MATPDDTSSIDSAGSGSELDFETVGSVGSRPHSPGSIESESGSPEVLVVGNSPKEPVTNPESLEIVKDSNEELDKLKMELKQLKENNADLLEKLNSENDTGNNYSTRHSNEIQHKRAEDYQRIINDLEETNAVLERHNRERTLEISDLYMELLAMKRQPSQAMTGPNSDDETAQHSALNGSFAEETEVIDSDLQIQSKAEAEAKTKAEAEAKSKDDFQKSVNRMQEEQRTMNINPVRILNEDPAEIAEHVKRKAEHVITNQERLIPRRTSDDVEKILSRSRRKNSSPFARSRSRSPDTSEGGEEDGAAAKAAADTAAEESVLTKKYAEAAKAAAVKKKNAADAARAEAAKAAAETAKDAADAAKAAAETAKAAAETAKADLEKARLALQNEKAAAGATQTVPSKCNCQTQENDLRRRLRQAEAYNTELMHLDTERDIELRKKSSQLADLHNLVKHYKRSNNGVIGKQEDTIANLHTAFCRILLCLPVDWFHGLATIAGTPICIGSSFADCCWISTTHDRTYHSVTVDGKTYKGSKCALDVIRKIAPNIEDTVNILPNLPITCRGVADGETMAIKAMRLLAFGRKPTFQQDLERLVQQNQSNSEIIQAIIHKESERSYGVQRRTGVYDMQSAMWMSNDFRTEFSNKYPMQCVFCCLYECLDILAAQESFGKSDNMEKRIIMQDKMQNMLSNRSIKWNPDKKIMDQIVQSMAGMDDVTIG